MWGRRSAVLAGVAVLTLVSAGCGDQGSPDAQEGAPTSSPASSAVSRLKSATPNKPSKPESNTKPTEPTPDEPTRQPDGRIATKCDATHLRSSIAMRDSAAGHRHAWLVLTNTSGTTCTVYGYGGMQLYDDQHEPVPTHLVRDRSEAPRTLRVAPGEKVRSTLRWSTVPHEGDRTAGPCQPAASVARVTPPDETRNLGTRWSYGPVCAGGRIVQQPYQGVALGPGD